MSHTQTTFAKTKKQKRKKYKPELPSQLNKTSFKNKFSFLDLMDGIA